MTIRELAEFTGVNTRTLYRWRDHAGMPFPVGRVEFLRWAAPRGWVREAVSKKSLTDELAVYHKAAMFDLTYPPEQTSHDHQ